jgi:hypothetical protein
MRNGQPRRHTEALAWPDDHDFIEITRHGQDQRISILYGDYHMGLTLRCSVQLGELRFGLV